ncbi:MAG: hypothetical protein ACOY3D_02150 [Candidatus Omnitrophota bacterium]
MTSKKWLQFLGLAVLIGITVFSFVHYYTLLDQNRILQKLVRSYEKKLSELELAKKAMEERLMQEKEALELELKSAQAELTKVNEELSAVKEKAGNLEKSNLDLLAQRQELEERVGAIAKEKEVLEAKFNSLDELKKAIRDLKVKLREERIAKLKQLQQQKEIAGNRGYLIYRGQGTSAGKVRIEVIPVP